MFRNRFLPRIVSIFMVSFFIVGCGVTEMPTTTDTEPKQEAEEATEEPAPTDLPETFSYVDAHGNYFVAVVDQRVEKVKYDWSKLKHKEGSDKISYDDGEYTIVKGVDVSHHNGVIDWQKVRSQGYEFAILRLGYRGYGKEGTLNVDEQFQSSFKAARAAGMKLGVYFFSQAINEKEAIEEAKLTLRELNGSKLELPVVYDPELIPDDDARTDEVGGTQFTKNTIAFCEKIKEAGYQPMVYSNLYWEATLFDLYELRDYPIWYADYRPEPQTPYRFEYWQYSESGEVEGISGGADLDVMFIKKKKKKK